MPKKLTTDEFVKKAIDVHGDCHDYSKVVYVLSNQKVLISCKHHGDFLQTPCNHLNGQGCPRCYGNIKITKTEFIKRSQNVHGNLYDYSKSEYKGNHVPICISCSKHGDFYQAPTSHWRGFECPKCACYRVSIPETEFLDFINIPTQNRQVCISQKKVDGCDPLGKIVYEFLGDYWHGNPDKYNPDHVNQFCKKSFKTLYTETVQKFRQLKSLGYQVHYIWEMDWKAFKAGKVGVPNIRNF